MTIQPANGGNERDPLGCAAAFREALARPELTAFTSGQVVGPESRRAALWLAVALGRCRLFGVGAAELDGVLPVQIALAAAEECSLQLRNLGQRVRALAEQWDAGLVDPDCELKAGQLLFIRMDLWAAVVAIDEAYQAWIRAKDSAAAALRRGISALAADSQALDDAMLADAEVVCVAAETSLLENWRALLVEPYSSSLPWWLDGTLEAAAGEMEERAVAAQPSGEALRRVRATLKQPEAGVPPLRLVDPSEAERTSAGTFRPAGTDDVRPWAAESTTPEKAHARETREERGASIYKLKAPPDRIFQLETDRLGRVFVILPADMLAVPPRGVLIQDQTFALKPGDECAFEIEDLGEGDLPDLAGNNFVVEGQWQ